MTNVFRTILPPVPGAVSIHHAHRTLCVGSCFAEHIGGRLHALKFPVLLNPFGIVYNPSSVARSLEQLLGTETYHPEHLFENQGVWHSFDHHGRFSHPNSNTALDNMNRSLAAARHFLAKADRLIVTLGTANVFVLKKTGTVVANCHKVPGDSFDRRRLSIAETTDALLPVFEKLKERLPALEIIATVSPVRHLRDGLVENQRSKAVLLLALEAINRQLPYVHYFPAYELLLDDLRDYRFYDSDMTHPAPLAVDYIWGYFRDAFFDEKTKALCGRIEHVLAAAAHRPFHPESEGHRRFIEKTLGEMDALERTHPGLDFSQERALLGHAGR